MEILVKTDKTKHPFKAIKKFTMKSIKRFNHLIGLNGYLLLLICPFITNSSYGQAVTLNTLYHALEVNYPLAKNDPILRSQSSINDNKLLKGYLPQLQINGQASYQSEITTIGGPNSIPGIPIPKKDQYKIGVGLQQNIFDGGTIEAQREANRLSGLTDLQQNTVNIYQLKEQLSSLFFQVHLLDENTRINESSLLELQTRLKVRQGALRYGTAQQSEIDALQAEVIRMKQQVDAAKYDRRTLMQNLSTLSGLPLTDSTRLFINGEAEPLVDSTTTRPEYELFKRQKQAIAAQYHITKSNTLPKVSLFGEENYGRPGYDFLRNTFGQYWIIGAKLNWSISGYYTLKHEKKITALKQQQIDVQREVFNINQSQQLTQQHNLVGKLNEQIGTDQQVIALRQKVLVASAAKLDNGTQTVADYIADQQALSQARYMKALHQAQLAQALEEINIINGKNSGK
jgi:outer membrane protein TolC